MTIREKEKGDGEEWTTLVTPPVHLNLPLKKSSFEVHVLCQF